MLAWQLHAQSRIDTVTPQPEVSVMTRVWWHTANNPGSLVVSDVCQRHTVQARAGRRLGRQDTNHLAHTPGLTPERRMGNLKQSVE